jgi:hypothetical protein
VAVSKKSSQVPPASSVPPIANHVTRSQGKSPTDALMASTATGDSFTYVEVMESRQQDHWKGAMTEECTLVLLNNLHLSSNGILILLYVDDIYVLYLEAATKPTIEVKAKFSEKYKIINLCPACLFLGIGVHCEANGISLDHNIQLDLAEDQGEKKLEDIKDNQAVVGSLMNAAHATWPDISTSNLQLIFNYSSRRHWHWHWQ